MLEYINKLPEKNVLYYDTDSIFYYSKHCEHILDVSRDLGCLDSQLNQNQYINLFVSTGPKSYSYVTNDLIEITHVKGFKLSKTLKEEKRINFDSLCDVLECKGTGVNFEQNDLFQVDSKLHIQKRNMFKKIVHF